MKNLRRIIFEGIAAKSTPRTNKGMKYKSKTIEDYEDSAPARFLRRPGIENLTRCSLEP